jgi:hypothetical protein
MNRENRIASFLIALESASEKYGIQITCLDGVKIFENRNSIEKISYDIEGANLTIRNVNYDN